MNNKGQCSLKFGYPKWCHRFKLRKNPSFKKHMGQIPNKITHQGWKGGKINKFLATTVFEIRLPNLNCYKNGKKSSWPVTGLWSRGPLKDLKDSKLILNESKLFPFSSRVTLVPFRTFRWPFFPKPVTGQEQEVFGLWYYCSFICCYCCWYRFLSYIHGFFWFSNAQFEFPTFSFSWFRTP